MPDKDRMRRINEIIRREITDYIEKNLAMDFGCLVTVNSVRVTPDLNQGVVFYSCYGADDKATKKAGQLLRKHRSKIQANINRNMKIRNTPVLEFRYDDSIAHGDKILRMFDDMGL